MFVNRCPDAVDYGGELLGLKITTTSFLLTENVASVGADILRFAPTRRSPCRPGKETDTGISDLTKQSKHKSQHLK